MASQTENGKAFEYACLLTAYNRLHNNQNVAIQESAQYNTAKQFFLNLNEETQEKMMLAAKAAMRILLRLEPQLWYASNDVESLLTLSIQADREGQGGDVRDVLFIRRNIDWEIGISCKHNHLAVKHSRLSRRINFGEQWVSVSCSQEYFNRINPIFDDLEEKKQRGLLWSEIEDKENAVYVPILNAFMSELIKIEEENGEVVPARLMEYLIGNNDFYKIIAIDNNRTTAIQPFNINGDLNRSAGNVRPESRVPLIPLPSHFFDIRLKDNSRNTVILTCDEGWTVSFRIHNASSRVEPSLKFDIKLEGIPNAVGTIIEPWNME